jgi:hypothetical protein
MHGCGISESLSCDGSYVYVLVDEADFLRPKTRVTRVQAVGADADPWHRARRSATWRRSDSSSFAYVRTVHIGVWTIHDDIEGLFFIADLDLASGEGPHRGGEIVGCVLASAGHSRRL